MKEISIIRITFPDIPLRTRDGHKLRGYFGNLFKEHSPLLHNHFADGRLRYAYPLVQYKVIDRVANLIGIKDGADLLAELFLKVRELEIEDKKYPILSKHIEHYNVSIGVANDLIEYQFLTPWMALSQSNYEKYKSISVEERKQLLKKILIGNVLSMYKGLDVWIDKDLLAMLWIRPLQVNFKNKRMIAFEGKFAINSYIPDYLGIGRSASRGFGTVKQYSH